MGLHGAFTLWYYSEVLFWGFMLWAYSVGLFWEFILWDYSVGLFWGLCVVTMRAYSVGLLWRLSLCDYSRGLLCVIPLRSLCDYSEGILCGITPRAYSVWLLWIIPTVPGSFWRAAAIHCSLSQAACCSWIWDCPGMPMRARSLTITVSVQKAWGWRVTEVSLITMCMAGIAKTMLGAVLSRSLIEVNCGFTHSEDKWVDELRFQYKVNGFWVCLAAPGSRLPLCHLKTVQYFLGHVEQESIAFRHMIARMCMCVHKNIWMFLMRKEGL